MPKIMPLLLSLSTISTLLAGCSPEADPKLQPATTPSMDKVPKLSLPLDSYRLTVKQDQKIKKIQAILTRDCMNKFGFDYPVNDIFLPNRLERRYGIDDLKVASVYGYLPDSSTPQWRNRQPPPEPPLIEQAILTGRLSKDIAAPSEFKESGDKGRVLGEYLGKPVPEGGCLREAERQTLDKGDSQAGGLLDKLDSDAYYTSMNDIRVRVAFKQWVSCMKSKGYDAKDPVNAGSKYLKERKSDAIAAPKREVDAAVTDVKCRQQTNLNGIWYAAETEYQNTAIEKNRLVLTKIKEDLKIKVKRLNDLVNKYNP